MTAYAPTDWVNDVPPPLSAENLNKLSEELASQASALNIANSLPIWTDGAPPALTDATPLNEMERVARLVEQQLPIPSYTPTVWEDGWTPARNAARMNHLEQQAMANRAALEAEPPPPPPLGALKWTPPGYPSYAGYVNWSPTNADARRSFSGANVLVNMPSTPITADGGINIANAANVVMIGGEIFDSNVLTPAQMAAGGIYRQIGLYLTGITAVAHIEGVWIHGAGVGDGVQSGNGNTQATMRLQNCRVHCQHPTQNLSQSPPNNFNGSHPDGLQCYNGPRHWQLYQDTIISTGTIRTWQSNGGVPRYIQTVHVERNNWISQTPTSTTYALWDDYPSASDIWSEYHEDLWFWTSPNHFGFPFHSLHRNGDAPNGFTPGQYGITGEATKWGLRPEGDWVPAPTVANPTCGVNYVSPGYA